MKFIRLMPALTGAVLMVMAAGQVAPARAGIDIYFRAGLPPADRSGFQVVYETPRPQYVMIPDSRVYMVRGADHDVYRYSGTYWAYDDGYWYRAPNYDGPWNAVRVERVPQQLIYVPAPYHTRWVTVPAEYRPGRGIIRQQVRYDRRMDRRERKNMKHEYKEMKHENKGHHGNHDD